jgi:hypothetical protein
MTGIEASTYPPPLPRWFGPRARAVVGSLSVGVALVARPGVLRVRRHRRVDASAYPGPGGGGLYPVAHAFADRSGFVAWGPTDATAGHYHHVASGDTTDPGGPDDPSGGALVWPRDHRRRSNDALPQPCRRVRCAPRPFMLAACSHIGRSRVGASPDASRFCDRSHSTGHDRPRGERLMRRVLTILIVSTRRSARFTTAELIPVRYLAVCETDPTI